METADASVKGLDVCQKRTDLTPGSVCANDEVEARLCAVAEIERQRASVLGDNS
jgi:hypothetical protein